jgi:hypothetical protein
MKTVIMKKHFNPAFKKDYIRFYKKSLEKVIEKKSSEQSSDLHNIRIFFSDLSIILKNTL